MARHSVGGDVVFLGLVFEEYPCAGPQVGRKTAARHRREIMRHGGVVAHSAGAEEGAPVHRAVVAVARVVGCDDPKRFVDVGRFVEVTRQSVARPPWDDAHRHPRVAQCRRNLVDRSVASGRKHGVVTGPHSLGGKLAAVSRTLRMTYVHLDIMPPQVVPHFFFKIMIPAVARYRIYYHQVSLGCHL